MVNNAGLRLAEKFKRILNGILVRFRIFIAERRILVHKMIGICITANRCRNSKIGIFDLFMHLFANSLFYPLERIAALKINETFTVASGRTDPILTLKRFFSHRLQQFSRHRESLLSVSPLVIDADVVVAEADVMRFAVLCSVRFGWIFNTVYIALGAQKFRRSLKRI